MSRTDDMIPKVEGQKYPYQVNPYTGLPHTFIYTNEFMVMQQILQELTEIKKILKEMKK